MSRQTDLRATDWSAHARKYNKPSGEALSMPMLRAGFEQHFFAALDAKVKESDGAVQVLALCGGTGPETLLVCERYGDKVNVLSTDTAQGMVDVAKEAIEAHGYQGFADARVMDAMNIDAAAHSYDVVLLILGPMLLPDADACFKHVARVLKQGGLFCTLTPGRMVIHDVFGASKAAVLQQSGRTSTMGNVYMDKIITPWGTPAALKQQLQRADVFASVDTAGITTTLRIASEEELDETLASLYDNPGMSFMYTCELSDEEKAQWKTAVRAELGKRSLGGGDNGGGLQMQANCGWARV